LQLLPYINTKKNIKKMGVFQVEGYNGEILLTT